MWIRVWAQWLETGFFFIIVHMYTYYISAKTHEHTDLYSAQYVAGSVLNDYEYYNCYELYFIDKETDR